MFRTSKKETGTIKRGNHIADCVVKEAAQGPMILLAKKGHRPPGKNFNKPRGILSEEEALNYLTGIHQLTHSRPKKMVKLVNRSPLPCSKTATACCGLNKEM